MIALQYGFDFCHTLTWINQRCTYVSSFRTSLPPPAHFRPLGNYRSPVWGPWVIWWIPTGCLFPYVSVYASMMLFHSSLPPLLHPCSQVCSLCLHLQCCSANGCIRASFSIPWSEVKSLSRVRVFATPWTVANRSPSMGFSRQGYWSGLPFPSPSRFHIYALIYCICEPRAYYTERSNSGRENLIWMRESRE